MAWIVVIETKSGSVVNSMNCDARSEREIDKIERGMGINMADEYHTEQWEKVKVERVLAKQKKIEAREEAKAAKRGK